MMIFKNVPTETPKIELFFRVKECLNMIPNETVRNCIHRMPKIGELVIKSHGEAIEY